MSEQDQRDERRPLLQATPVGAEPPPAISLDPLQRLLESQLFQANSMVVDKLQSFKCELSEDNALLLESAFKRLKKDSLLRFTFKNEGNKRQYEHQEKVLEFFSQAQTCITSNKFEKAAEKIEQSITLVKKNRMKLIKLQIKANLVGGPPLNVYWTTWLLTTRMRSVYRNLNVQRKKLNVKRVKSSNRKCFNLPLERRLLWVRSCRLVLELAHVLR